MVILHAAGPQAQIDSGDNRTYLLSDALSSIRGVTDGSGALVGSTSYDAFGAIRSQTGTSSALGYTGELYTPDTGLLHLRARDLNPTLGRFPFSVGHDPMTPNETAIYVGLLRSEGVGSLPCPQCPDQYSHQSPPPLFRQFPGTGYNPPL